MRRCFLAIRIPAYTEPYNSVKSISKGLDVKLNPVDPELYHFTVHFFGDIEETEVENIRYHLDNFEFDPFDIKVETPKILPTNNPNKTRVLFLEPTEGETQLMMVVNDIQSILRYSGFKVNKQKYIPHLTVARVKYGRDKSELAKRWMDLQFDLDGFTVDKIELIHSVLTQSGPIYTTIHSTD